MVCLATLAPAATAADATGFALLKRYLDGREPALPEGCVLDVELEAKALPAQFLTAGRAAVEEAYRGMRAELGWRPMPTKLFHSHYLPQTLRAAHGGWFGFCRAEGDLDVSEERVFERFGARLGMVESTSLNKSYKMVVLRVLLDRDALWAGLEIPRLAASCRSFLDNHPPLRADLEGAAFTRVPGDAALDMENFAAWWLEWPLSMWLKEQAGGQWFKRHGERFMAKFTCPARAPRGLRIANGRTCRSPSRTLHTLASVFPKSPSRKRRDFALHRLPRKSLPLRRQTNPLPPHRGIRAVPPHAPSVSASPTAGSGSSGW